MKIKALVSFSGAISMYKGEIKEYNDKVVLQDLLNCRYVEEIKEGGTNENKRSNNSNNKGVSKT